ncbi:cytochrome P450 [Mycolicibacterium sp.]|uniref:cytochrome P450 n=1 Tax=Mycolicibacterium sp. TaxID=2320850 RepID=UPI00355D97B6
MRIPVLGDILTIDFAKPTQGLTAQMRKLGGGIMEQRVFDVPVIVLADPALIDEVNDESTWEKHLGHSIRKLRPVAGDGLFTAYNHEPNWRKAHNILRPAFTKSAMLTYHDTMAATVRELLEAWTARPAWIDIPAEANRLTIEIIARAGFGYSFSRLDGLGDNPFISAVLRELNYANRRSDAVPMYEKLFGQRLRRQHYADKAFIRGQVADIIEARRLNAAGPAGSDILDTMLHSADPDTGEKLDDNNMVNQLLTLLVAGSETTANTIAFALHYLATNPEIAKRARAEIDERWPDRTCPDIGFDDVAKLRYLRRVIDETLRLWPVAPGYFRQAKADTTIGNGAYTFEAGDWVFVLLVAAHRDPSWGPDAAEFNPDRFLSENLRKLGPRTYKPFGTGARACIGRQFALHESVLTLAMLLHQFDIEADPDYRLSVSETLTLKPEGLRLRFHPR